MFGEDGDPHQSLTRKNEEDGENDSGTSTAADDLPNYLPSYFVARLFGFPPTEDNVNVDDGAVDGDAKKSDDDDSPTTKTITQVEKSTPTLFSSFNHDHGTKTETFPIKIAPERHCIISTCIATALGILLLRPFQIFAVFCMVYLSSQVLYLIHKTGEGKSWIILTVIQLVNKRLR